MSIFFYYLQQLLLIYPIPSLTFVILQIINYTLFPPPFKLKLPSPYILCFLKFVLCFCRSLLFRFLRVSCFHFSQVLCFTLWNKVKRKELLIPFYVSSQFFTKCSPFTIFPLLLLLNSYFSFMIWIWKLCC